MVPCPRVSSAVDRPPGVVCGREGPSLAPDSDLRTMRDRVTPTPTFAGRPPVGTKETFDILKAVKNKEAGIYCLETL